MWRAKKSNKNCIITYYSALVGIPCHMWGSTVFNIFVCKLIPIGQDVRIAKWLKMFTSLSLPNQHNVGNFFNINCSFTYTDKGEDIPYKLVIAYGLS